MVDFNEKHGQGTHCTKMGADKLAENTPNAPKFICPSPNVWDFNEKRLHWASVVCCLWTRHRYRVSIISFLGNLLF